MEIPHPTPTTTMSTFLLVVRDDGKPESWGQQTGHALAGAMLTDLALAGRLGVDDGGKRLRVLDATPTGDALLDEGLRRFAAKDGKRLSSIIGGVGRKLDREVGDYLAARGVLRVEEGGLLRGDRYPTVDPVPERELRARLHEVLRGATPDVSEHAVIGLVTALDIAGTVFDADEVGMSKRDLKRRVKEVAESAGAGPDAVDRAIKEVSSAVMASIIASTVIAGAGAGS